MKTENYYADDTSVAYGRVPKGEYVKLTVSDNGCGIPDDIILKILDPFFSTKTTDKKRGSGLGLSVVDAVMRDHNGYLDLDSTVGHGTSFFLYFPVTREEAGEVESEYRAGGDEKVLVVDDDEIQREVTTQLLQKLGYRVNSVECGETALEFLRNAPQDLVILDMVMPGGIDGTETYRRILEISPQQKAIILSGFSESDRVLKVQKLGAGAFVRKPVSKRAIAAAIRSELDRPVGVSSS
jgi:CheY-like chemotaxis protein